MPAQRTRNSILKTFWENYEGWCSSMHRATSRHVHQEFGLLSINMDRIPSEHIQPILKAILSDQSLQHINFYSSFLTHVHDNEGLINARHRGYDPTEKIPAFQSRDSLTFLGKALNQQLSNNANLHSLFLEGVIMAPDLVGLLAQGISNTKSLHHLSLAHSPLTVKNTKELCFALKKNASLKTLDFTDCHLTVKSFESIANLIKTQEIRLFCDVWKKSLRYNIPCIDDFRGIRRISLSSNPSCGDEGALILADALLDDFWMKALDLQWCNIGTQGGEALCNVLWKSTMFEVLDLRNNPKIKKSVLKKIVNKLKENIQGKVREYEWLHVDPPLELSPSELPKSAPPYPIQKIGVQKKPLKQIPRSRSLSEPPPLKKKGAQKETSYGSTKAITKGWDSHYQCRANNRKLAKEIEKLKEELEALKLELRQEKDTRESLFQENLKLLEERNLKLRSPPPGMILVDEQTLQHIHTTFHKFQSFLDMINSSGFEVLFSEKQNKIPPSILSSLSSFDNKERSSSSLAAGDHLSLSKRDTGEIHALIPSSSKDSSLGSLKKEDIPLKITTLSQDSGKSAAPTLAEPTSIQEANHPQIEAYSLELNVEQLSSGSKSESREALATIDLKSPPLVASIGDSVASKSPDDGSVTLPSYSDTFEKGSSSLVSEGPLSSPTSSSPNLSGSENEEF